MADDEAMVELMERMRAGDAIAVHEFYLRVEPFLRNMARRLLNPGLRRQVDSTDVAESVFRRVLTGSMRARFENETRLMGWMATIVRNRIRTLSRRTKGPGGGSFEEYLEGGTETPREVDPAAWAENADEVHRFRLAMERLPEAEREVIALREFEQLPFQQVADLMERPSADAVRKLHKRALKRLRATIEKVDKEQRA